MMAKKKRGITNTVIRTDVNPNEADGFLKETLEFKSYREKKGGDKFKRGYEKAYKAISNKDARVLHQADNIGSNIKKS